MESQIISLQKEELKYFKKQEVSIKIPTPVINNYISELEKKDLSEALNYIGLSFIPNEEIAKNTIFEIEKKHPFLFRIQKYIKDHKGREVAQIRPLKDDLKDNIIHHINQLRNVYSYCFWQGLYYLEKNKSLNASTLAQHLFKSPVFPKENHQIIKEGLTSYFNKNYIASCSILIPQIESAVRELIFINGGKIYKPPTDSQDKGFVLKPLGALLRDNIFIKTCEKINKDIPLFFSMVLVDKRALNLRNNVCHGDFPASFFNPEIAIYIIHILLILSLL